MPKITLNLSPQLFNDAYRPYLLDYSRRYQVFYGGSGSGKSHFLAQKIVLKALSTNQKILIVRKVARTLRDSVFQLVIDTLKQFQLIDRCSVNYSTFTIELPNSSILLFKGVDDGEKLKSITGLTSIWIEEASELTLDDFTQLDLRLRANQPNQIICLSFNPVSKVNWVYKKWFEKPSENPDTLILRTTYRDNRFLPESYIKTLEALESTNPTYYRIYALGEFASLDKLIYTNWTAQDFDYKAIKGACIVGLDFGYTADPSALIASIATPQKQLYIYSEHYQQGLLNNQIADIIKYKGLAKEIIIADSAEQKSIEEIKREGIPRIKPATKGQGSVLHGIQKLQQYQIIVHPSCVNTITELQNYSWEKDKHSNEYTNSPSDSFNHLMDALRYSIQAIDTNRLQTLPIRF